MEQGSNLFYYIFLIVISIIALAGYKKPKTGFFIMIILLFFSMFRGEYVGNDTKNYMSEDRIQYRGGNLDVEYTTDFFMDNFGSSTELIDIGLNRLVYGFNLPPRFIIWAYALITIIVLYNALRKYRVNTSIGLLIYVLSGLYYFSLSAARQMAAVSIVLYALTFVLVKDSYLKPSTNKKSILKSDFVSFCSMMLIAAMIHTSAFFFVVIYPLRYLRLNKNLVTIILSFVCTACVLLAIDPMSYIFSVVNMEYISRYLGLYDDGGRSLMGRLFDIPRFIFFILIFYKGVKYNITESKDNYYALALFLMAIFIQTNGLLARITYYLTAFMCVYISKVLVNDFRLRKGVLYTLFMLYILLSIYGTGGGAVSSLTSGYYLMF